MSSLQPEQTLEVDEIVEKREPDSDIDSEALDQGTFVLSPPRHGAGRGLVAMLWYES